MNTEQELAKWFNDFKDLYERKLYHQLSLKLEQFFQQDDIYGDVFVQFYYDFMSQFESQINPLKLSHFAVVVSRQYSEKDAAINFLEEVIEKVKNSSETRTEEAILYMKMQIAALKLQKGEQKECKALIDQGQTTIQTRSNMDPSVNASVYCVAFHYHKSREEFAGAYRSGLLYLAYTSLDTLKEDVKLGLAIDLSLAALQGDDIYDFGELVAHDIVKSLQGTGHKFLYHMLMAFNVGDLVGYQHLCERYGADMNTYFKNQAKLHDKITILCLMEIIHSYQAYNRTIQLAVVADRARLRADEVELLLMKCISLRLIHGILDPVEGTITVSSVQPKVLGLNQLPALRDRLDNWLHKVHTTVLAFESEASDL